MPSKCRSSTQPFPSFVDPTQYCFKFRCAMARVLRSAELFMSPLVLPSMLKSNQESLLVTHLVRSFQLKSVGLDAPMKRELRSAMIRSLPPLWMCLKKFVISTHRKPADSQQNLCQNLVHNISVLLCQRKLAKLGRYLKKSQWIKK